LKSYLTDKTVLITGGAKRIGRQIATSLARHGINAVIHYKSSAQEAQALQNRLHDLGVKSWTIQMDLCSETDLSEFISLVRKRVGKLDFLINNASIFHTADLDKLGFEDLITNISVNSWAPFSLTRSFVNEFDEGKVINLLDTRIAGYDWDHVGYYLSKVLLERITKMMALKYAPEFTVNGIAPGLITPPTGGSQEYLKKRLGRVPLETHGEKTDVAEAVLFLLQSSFITGQIIYVDGGRNLLHELEG